MDRNDREVIVLPTNMAISRAAELFMEAMESLTGEVAVCLTGGEEARLLYEEMANQHIQKIPWRRTRWFWSDERFVPPESEHSNVAMAKRILLEPGGASPDSISAIPTIERGSPAEAAAQYALEIASRRVQRHEARLPLFDIVLHGIGADGHTASLYPGRPHDVDERRRLALGVEMSEMPPLLPRVSLTLSALNDSNLGLMLALGEDKREAVARALAEDKIPAALTDSRGRMIWILDEAAGGGIS